MERPARHPRRREPRYVELRCQSAFSFLCGASLPEDLVARAQALGHTALALTDRDGVYGAPRFYKAAKEAGLRALVGANLSLEGGERLLVLCRDRAGYQRLCRLVTEGKLRHPKGEGRVTWADVAAHAQGLVCLSGGLTIDREKLGFLTSSFGRENVFVEVGRHLSRAEEPENERLVALARAARLPVVATNDVRYATPGRARLYDVLTCLRHHTTLDLAGSRLSPNAERHLKSAREMAALFSDLPEAVENTLGVAERCAFTLEDLGYRFPEYPVPEGETLFSYLHQLTYAGARERYRPLTAKAARQLARELDLIDKLQLAGYFLIVWDLVRFCKERGILAQGRGSAANSAVCYSLGITAVDPVGMDLLFERFLSEERGEWPDIDLDLPSGDQREQVIQYVYRRYGERGAAMTANVITYRGRSAVRDVGKALGFSQSQLDRLSRLWRGYGFRESLEHLPRDLLVAGFDPQDARVRLFIGLCQEIEGLPRHLGQHSGGMVIAAGRLDEVTPLEPATMPGRVVIQWDKDDCADLGIIKVDLLGLGMMAVLEEAVGLVRAHEGVEVDLAHLPEDDPKIYDMLCAADTVGVFQVESRAQMATLPRLKPRRFYDLVVEVAIIRPGPVVGQMVHPYLNRRAGREPVVYAHPLLEPILARTLGVPLFQEQLMRIAMTVGGFTGGQAEELRRAMGFKRSAERMRTIEEGLRAGMTERKIAPQVQDEIVRGITSFALYGFPESHAASFALLVYASAYLKVYHPAAFCCGLLNHWPMGFYHPATLVGDALRHGVGVLPIDVNHSTYRCRIEDGAVRLGLRYVAGLGREVGLSIEAARPFTSPADLGARTPVSREVLHVLSEIGAFGSLGLGRREALWQATAVAREGKGLFAGVMPGDGECPLPEMSPAEETVADYRGTGMTVGPHPMAYLREELARQGVRAAGELARLRGGTWVKVAGMVIVRQRPGTAKGFVFLTLEDETGLTNAIVEPQVFEAHRAAIVTSPFLILAGRVQQLDGTVSVKAYRFRPLRVGQVPGMSHDFY
jgi:error-prone DNA polymerase